MVPDLGDLDTAPTVYPSRVPADEAKLVFYAARPLRMQVINDILPQPKIGKTEPKGCPANDLRVASGMEEAVVRTAGLSGEGEVVHAGDAKHGV
ncbi:hypothetical protein, partial [Streptomyces albidoflavus]|uniref:hypothetical protein n=1 Tax=Streptomyces albidoflavus TaxID=1886 RepID=UPI00405657EB